MAPFPIRVLLVEDSPVALTILQRILASSAEIEVAGVAHNGIEALELIPTLQPAVVCTDLHMPKMGGLELTRRIMAECPRPILVISTSVQEEDTENVFRVLQAGALDIFPNPRTGLPSEYEQVRVDLINRIKVLAGVSIFTRRFRQETIAPATTTKLSASIASTEVAPALNIRMPRVLAIGASTGGPQAFHTILRQLPASFPVPILCVHHISDGFLQGFVDWLAAECAVKITIAQTGQIPKPGTVYFPPERHHLKIDIQGQLSLSNEPPVAGHCPSVTVLFRSVAAYYRRSCVGVLLTGMGRDGADGMLAISQAGGMTIAQDEASCIVFGMPREAIALGAVQYTLPLNNIPPMLLSKVFGNAPG